MDASSQIQIWHCIIHQSQLNKFQVQQRLNTISKHKNGKLSNKLREFREVYYIFELFILHSWFQRRLKGFFLQS